ncbi:uncharacterized protein LOC116301628 [Actinia tenebrosa]|uniref:Uncharacterized protein LOC116301628 n=1 Tax=Actinia tenebrosa TaxID=6105 RepID=A0A6P8IIS2_ACTTE|nr:uncharacterized protein LOC116301628 [Actinia tenebrosa]
MLQESFAVDRVVGTIVTEITRSCRSIQHLRKRKIQKMRPLTITHLCLFGSVYFLPIVIAQLDLFDQSRILGPRCKWNCTDYWVKEILCKPINKEGCQEMIDRGEPCCIVHLPIGGIKCLNKSSKDNQIRKCLRPFENETQAKEGHCHPMYHPMGTEGSVCKSFSGKILSTVDVLTEFQCMDLCMRNWRCVAFNIYKSEVKSRPCQLLESYHPSSECKTEYIGKKLDREAFYKAYLNPGCTVQEVT